jgi:hypothetical protein
MRFIRLNCVVTVTYLTDADRADISHVTTIDI